MNNSVSSNSMTVIAVRNTFLSAIVFVWLTSTIMLTATATLSPDYKCKETSSLICFISLVYLLLNFTSKPPVAIKYITRGLNFLLAIADGLWVIAVSLLPFYKEFSLAVFIITSAIVPAILLFSTEISTNCKMSLKAKGVRPDANKSSLLLGALLILLTLAFILYQSVLAIIVISCVPVCLYVINLLLNRYLSLKWGGRQFIIGLLLMSSAWVLDLLEFHIRCLNPEKFISLALFMFISSCLFILSAFCPLKKANKP